MTRNRTHIRTHATTTELHKIWIFCVVRLWSILLCSYELLESSEQRTTVAPSVARECGAGAVLLTSVNNCFFALAFCYSPLLCWCYSPIVWKLEHTLFALIDLYSFLAVDSVSVLPCPHKLAEWAFLVVIYSSVCYRYHPTVFRNVLLKCIVILLLNQLILLHSLSKFQWFPLILAMNCPIFLFLWHFPHFHVFTGIEVVRGSFPLHKALKCANAGFTHSNPLRLPPPSSVDLIIKW